MNEEDQRRKSPSLQFSLLSLLLMATLVGVWFANWRISQSIATRRAELPALRNYARELVVADPQGFSVVSPHQLWIDDYRWRLYVPTLPSGEAQLALRTNDISDTEFENPDFRAPLSAGKHDLQLKYELIDEEWVIQVLVDGQPVIDERLPREWNTARGSRGGNTISQLDHFQKAPVQLFHRRFMDWNATGGAREGSNGLHLWIETE